MIVRIKIGFAINVSLHKIRDGGIKASCRAKSQKSETTIPQQKAKRVEAHPIPHKKKVKETKKHF